MEFYRYDISTVGETSIRLSIFTMERETPKGYWINDKWNISRKWVSKSSRKRFAYPTKSEAKTSLLARTRRRKAILRNQLFQVEEGLKLLENSTI